MLYLSLKWFPTGRKLIRNYIRKCKFLLHMKLTALKWPFHLHIWATASGNFANKLQAALLKSAMINNIGISLFQVHLGMWSLIDIKKECGERELILSIFIEHFLLILGTILYSPVTQVKNIAFKGSSDIKGCQNCYVGTQEVDFCDKPNLLVILSQIFNSNLCLDYLQGRFGNLDLKCKPRSKEFRGLLLSTWLTPYTL